MKKILLFLFVFYLLSVSSSVTIVSAHETRSVASDSVKAEQGTEICEERGTITGTRFIVPQMVDFLKNRAFFYHVELVLDEDYGWFYDTVRFTLKGKKSDVIEVLLEPDWLNKKLDEKK